MFARIYGFDFGVVLSPADFQYLGNADVIHNALSHFTRLEPELV